ncbi:hypothetical protein [Kiritimatiella glycovorans]|nr:hypothetical protein [Kiritimatiella glycovorans]
MRIDAEKDFGERECPGCAGVVEENENTCPICGYEFPRESRRRRAGRITAMLAALLAFLALVLLGRLI